MKTQAIMVYLNQLAGEVEKRLQTEQDEEEVCGLLDAKEYMRRAWHRLGGTPFIPNDTTDEQLAIAIKGAK